MIGNDNGALRSAIHQTECEGVNRIGTRLSYICDAGVRPSVSIHASNTQSNPAS